MTQALDETHRQQALDRYRVLDSLPEQSYDDIVQLAAAICDVPMALVSLIDRDRQWFKAKLGLDDDQTERRIAFCDHAIREPERLMEIKDAREDARFRDNPLVTDGLNIRFYAGAPLVNADGAALGTVCVIDDEPKELDERQRESLQALARLTMSLLDARQAAIDAARHGVLATVEAVDALALPPVGFDGLPNVGTVPVATSPAGAAATVVAMPKRTVVLFEMQDYAGAVKRMGERVVERELERLADALSTRLDPAAGDSLTRVTGSAELIAVVHGDSVFASLQGLQDQATAFEADTSLRVLSAFAESQQPGERLDDVFLRADAALSRRKDEARAA